jgi:hypothetical protein
MQNNNWHLAQINIARIAAEKITDPVMQTFVAQLEEVNAIAESSPGFVWRLKDDSNNATSFNPFNDERIIVNMSVWETLDQLMKFVYDGRHLEVLKRRREWFVNFGKPFAALWYLPAGDIPTVDEGVRRLSTLQEKGPTSFAFDLRKSFDPPAKANFSNAADKFILP